MQRTIQDIKKYERAHYSWFGRINILKMDIIPRFLYLFQTIPIAVPRSFFTILQSTFTRFIWGCNRPRLQRRILSLPKTKGGAGAPDLYYYHAAAVLTRLVNWFHHSHLKQWVHIEQSIAPLDLQALPWLDISARGPPSSVSFLTAHLLRTWDKLQTQLGLSPKVGLMTPLFGNPGFLPAMARRHFLVWSRESNRRISQIIHQGDLPLLSDLIPTQQQSIKHWLEYRQITSFLSSFPSIDVFNREPDTFESLLLQQNTPEHILSAVYGVLILRLHTCLPEFTNKWKMELNVEIKPEEWEKAFILTHSMSLAIKAHETNFKLLSRWYRCPLLLHQIYPNVSDLCWRCHSAKGSLLHIWWECPSVHNFWDMILQLHTRATGVTIPNTPQITLLSILPGSYKSIKKGLLRHWLTAARAVIPRHWRSAHAPSLTDWILEMDHIERMETLLSQELDTYEQCRQIWLPWKVLRESPELRNLYVVWR